ncbi:DUF4845 domain-containing protein [Pseudomarimonas salicorniae]|uniref:DUF4845 domain-containing protein n=1 Tax=Pseudomarimonas salicorniae TaxID=2933270 RepID=A0ABT0GJU1_9GAMM|nr:DUF4845 domain-containing protein [Lysobacter sp. CAU 1642]MCK7594805.1 DUF4845 domain-containing protein [Lysobacter sp. CAU 1642]
MTTRKAQQGITLMGMIITLAVLGIFGYCGMKIFPMYQEYWSVKDSMEEVAKTPGIANAGRAKVVDLLFRRFNISYVESVKNEHITLDTKRGAVLTIKYEVRRHVAYNLDVVGKFEHSVELSN